MVKISPKFQVVIPLEVRRSMKIRPGQRMQVIGQNGHITLIPIRDIKTLRGSCPGIDTNVERDTDRV